MGYFSAFFFPRTRTASHQMRWSCLVHLSTTAAPALGWGGQCLDGCRSRSIKVDQGVPKGDVDHGIVIHDVMDNQTPSSNCHIILGTWYVACYSLDSGEGKERERRAARLGKYLDTYLSKSRHFRCVCPRPLRRVREKIGYQLRPRGWVSCLDYSVRCVQSVRNRLFWGAARPLLAYCIQYFILVMVVGAVHQGAKARSPINSTLIY